jgi:glutaredoxin
MISHALAVISIEGQPEAVNAAPSSSSAQFRPLVQVLRALGIGRGVWKQRRVGPRPGVPLQLFSTEGCPACRRVRRALTELDLDFIHRSCPRGDSPKRRELRSRGGKMQVPYLVDPNTGVEMYQSRSIVDYLQRTYGAIT